MSKFTAIVVMLLIPLVATPQTVVPQPGQFNNTVQVFPGAMSTSLTCLVGFASTCIYRLTPTGTSTDPYLCSGDMTADGETVLIQDANSVPLMSGTLGASGTKTTFFLPLPLTKDDTGCRIMPGGVYVQAGGAGVTFRLTIKFNK